MKLSPQIVSVSLNCETFPIYGFNLCTGKLCFEVGQFVGSTLVIFIMLEKRGSGTNTPSTIQNQFSCDLVVQSYG